MSEKGLSGHESLQLIQQMIQVAKDDHREKGDGWLLWGWLLFVASAASTVLAFAHIRGYIGWIWTAMLVVGLGVFFIMRIRRKKTNVVQTYMQELLHKIGLGFFISLFALIAASNLLNNIGCFGYYYVLYAFWMFIHGSAIRFRPLILGAWINWIAAILIFMIKDIGWIMLISSVAILAGYLVPGYLLRADYRKRDSLKDRINA